MPQKLGVEDMVGKSWKLSSLQIVATNDQESYSLYGIDFDYSAALIVGLTAILFYLKKGFERRRLLGTLLDCII